MSDDLRTRLTADEFIDRARAIINEHSRVLLHRSTLGRVWDALLADPAPEAARVSERVAVAALIMTGQHTTETAKWTLVETAERLADLPVATGVTTEDEGPEPCAVQFCSALRTRGKFCDRHAYKNPVCCEHGELLADPCAECHFDANADDVPAPVVSAGDEAAREAERVRAAVADLHREVHEALPIEQPIEKCRLCTPAADLPVATGAEVDSLDAPPVVIEEVLRLATKERATGVTTEDEGPHPAVCGDWPAPCNCDDPETHDGVIPAPAPVVPAGDEGLSKEEREALEVVFLDYRRGRFVLPNPIYAAVERILADREARRG